MTASTSSLLTLKSDGPVAFLQLDDGKGNVLGTRMLQAIDKALDDAESSRVLVLSGREKIFSGGLDLMELVSLDRSSTGAFLELFDRVFLKLLRYPRPIITVARGAAVAGGAILLCAGDARLVTPNGSVGVNEVAIGLSIPLTALELVREALGAVNAFEAATTGQLYSGDARLRVGFATEVVSPDAIDARARELAAERAKLDPTAVARVRFQLRRPAFERIAAHGAEDTKAFINSWFTPETQAILKGIVERLRSKG